MMCVLLSLHFLHFLLTFQLCCQQYFQISLFLYFTAPTCVQLLTLYKLCKESQFLKILYAYHEYLYGSTYWHFIDEVASWVSENYRTVANSCLDSARNLNFRCQHSVKQRWLGLAAKAVRLQCKFANCWHGSRWQTVARSSLLSWYARKSGSSVIGLEIACTG